MTDSFNLQPLRHTGTVTNEIMLANYASKFAERILNRIREYDVDLDDAHEVGVRLVSFGQTVVFHVEDIGYSNPSLIWFVGTTDNGEPIELIQHISQISILLMKLPRQNPERPKRPIGFHEVEEEEER